MRTIRIATFFFLAFVLVLGVGPVVMASETLRDVSTAPAFHLEGLVAGAVGAGTPLQYPWNHQESQQ